MNEDAKEGFFKMPLSKGDLAPNFILQELSKGDHPYRQQADRPKFHLWENFPEKPRILFFLRDFPNYPGEELFSFLDQNYEQFSETVHILPCINANAATFVESPYRKGKYKMPLYACFTDDIRKYNQLSMAGTQPFMGLYLMESGNEPKILQYISFDDGMGEELNQEITRLIESIPKTRATHVQTTENLEVEEDGINQ